MMKCTSICIFVLAGRRQTFDLRWIVSDNVAIVEMTETTRCQWWWMTVAVVPCDCSTQTWSYTASDRRSVGVYLWRCPAAAPKTNYSKPYNWPRTADGWSVRQTDGPARPGPARPGLAENSFQCSVPAGPVIACHRWRSTLPRTPLMDIKRTIGEFRRFFPWIFIRPWLHVSCIQTS